MYDALAPFYDELMDFDYDEYVERLWDWCPVTGKKVLELGCGSAEITKRLLHHADQILALDPSEMMLSVAQNKVASPRVRFLQGQSDRISSPERFDVVVACLDVINYISPEDLPEHWREIYRHMKAGGRFFFDLSSEKKLKEELGNQTFFLRSERVELVWSNELLETGVQMDLVLYEKKNHGLWKRYEEQQYQYLHTKVHLCQTLEACGFREIRFEEEHDRWFLSAVR